MFYLPGDENAWEAWETDENGKETKVDTEARKQESIQYSKEEISGYNDNDWYTAYVSINKLMDYKAFIDWFEKLSDKKVWSGEISGVQFTQKKTDTATSQTLVFVRMHLDQA